MVDAPVLTGPPVSDPVVSGGGLTGVRAALAEELADLTEVRARRPQAVAEAASRRQRRPLLDDDGRLLLIAADHPARGALAVGSQPFAMGDRLDMLARLRIALSRPGVDGVLGSPDVVEDLLLLGALEGRVVIGSMNRGGLAGAAFELDDRFTGYDAEACERSGLDGGKMLIRLDLSDPGTARTLQACAQAVSALARRGLMAMVEPFWSSRMAGRVSNDLSADAVIRSIHVAQALGDTSAHTWLKLPVVPDMERVLRATTLPTLVLGGDPTGTADDRYDSWRAALALPPVRGLVIGRALLYPEDGDVAGAVDMAVGMVR